MAGHVCHVITRLDVLGGAQIHLYHLAGALSRRGWKVTVLSGTEGVAAERLRALGIPCVPVPELVHPVHPLKDWAAARALARLLRVHRPDLVCTHSSKAGFLGRWAAHRLGIPAVFTVHGWGLTPGTPQARRALALAAERLAARWSRRILCVSEFDRHLALQHRIGRPETVLAIPNGLPDHPARACPDGPGPVRIAMVARFAPPKDHSTLLRAVAGLPDRVEVLLIGDGPRQEAARSEARQLGIADRVEFAGARPDVAEALAGAHIFALATRWEGLPLAVLEAMRAGLPVVASDVGGIREAVVEGETGYLVPAGDPAALRRRLRCLLDDPGLRRQMGASGRSRYEARFTLEPMVRRTEEVYREVLTGTG